jgi:fatty-acyl-CoA synthase
VSGGLRQRLADGVAALSLLGPAGVLGRVAWTRVPHAALAAARAGLGLAALVPVHAAQHPDAEALVDEAGRRWSWAALERDTRRLAAALAAVGAGPGAAVALHARNRAELWIAQLAAMRAGLTAVQLGSGQRAGELAPMLANATPRAALVEAAVRAEFDAACALAGVAPTVLALDELDGVLAAVPERAPLPRAGDVGDAGSIVYTSGTTGRPKGAHRAWRKTGLQAGADLIRRVGIRTDERHLVVCPLYHSAAPAIAGIVSMLGGTVVVADGFEPERVLALVARERITSILVVPTMLDRLAALAPEVRARHDLSSLRWVLSGAAPLATETAARFQAAYGAILWNFYGSTENGLVSLAAPSDHATYPGTVGTLLAGVTIELLSAAGRPVARGEIGELHARTATEVTGYHRDPEATKRARRDAGFSVGDLARQDLGGHLYLAARTHDLIISGGVNIYPRELEDRLRAHPAVADAAVLGQPDPEWGERVVAAIVVRAGAAVPTLDEVRAWIGATHAAYKRPRELWVVEALPYSATGKLDKRALAASR